MRDLTDHPVPHRIRLSGDGLSLIDYLTDVVTRSTRAEIEEAIAEGRFRWRTSEEPLGPDEPVVAGEMLLADIPDMTPNDPFMPPPPTTVVELLRDDDLLVVDKPAGVLCYPLGPRKIAAQSLAEQQLRRAGEPDALRPLHRIDRETSGVLMFARTLVADQRVKEAFRKRQVQKSYLAIVRGRLEGGPQTVDAPIGPDDGDIRVKMRVRDDGKAAQTRVEPLGWFGATDFGEAGPGFTWVVASPITGRAHQIRVHLAHLGHPLVGDKIYCDGGEAFLRWWDGALSQEHIDALGMPRQALHAWTLSCRHPMDEAPMWITAPVPADMLAFAATHGGAPPASPTPPPQEE